MVGLDSCVRYFDLNPARRFRALSTNHPTTRKPVIHNAINLFLYFTSLFDVVSGSRGAGVCRSIHAVIHQPLHRWMSKHFLPDHA